MAEVWRNVEAGRNGPLDGVRVVDFSRIVSGPFATQILGDLGADVVKIEFVDVGDEVRSYGLDSDEEEINPSVNPGATFLAMNRNKRSLALDVRTDVGKQVALRLIADADVVLHNFRTGVMDRLGLGYEEVSSTNRGLIYCSISGFGSIGPLAEKPANDLIIQAHSGLLSFTGSPSMDEPVRNPTPVCDIAAGMYAVIGILAALNHRHESGTGQHVQTNMLGGQMSMQNYILVDYWLNGIVPTKLGSGNRMGQPNQAFPTSDGWVCIVASGQSAWAQACKALELPKLADDPRFRTLQDRYRHAEEMVDAISAVTRRLTTKECVHRLEEAGVPSGPVYTLKEAVVDPQFQALADAGGVVQMPVGTLGDTDLVMTPIDLSATPVSARLSPPSLGEHSTTILEGLGFSESEIESLLEARVVHSTRS